VFRFQPQIYPVTSVDTSRPILEYIETFDRKELMKTIPELPTGVTHFINGDTLAFIGDVVCSINIENNSNSRLRMVFQGRNRLGLILCLPADPKEAEHWGWSENAGPERCKSTL
jgi:hypothetical protein